MAAGTAVMHFPSPRSTVKKEEPARRVQKIKADEVRRFILVRRRKVVSFCRDKPQKSIMWLYMTTSFDRKARAFLKSDFVIDSEVIKVLSRI